MEPPPTLEGLVGISLDLTDQKSLEVRPLRINTLFPVTRPTHQLAFGREIIFFLNCYHGVKVKGVCLQSSDKLACIVLLARETSDTVVYAVQMLRCVSRVCSCVFAIHN